MNRPWRLPDRVVEVLATVGPDTDVLVSDVSARSFAAVIRRSYSTKQPNLVPFIDPLQALGDEARPDLSGRARR